MKTPCFAVFWLSLAMVRGAAPTVDFVRSSVPVAAEPIITSIQLEGTNLVVQANVPPGLTSVTLEGCRRLNGEGWTPKAVGRVNRNSGQLTFRLAQASGLELLRIRGGTEDALPDFFFGGETAFTGQPVNAADVSAGAFAGTAVGPAGGLTPNGTLGGTDGSAPVRAVTESDIWRLNGDTLYFFNQYRGLQVIDVSQPDAPVVLGTLPLSAAGEQMYLLDDTHVVLLAQDGCNGGPTGGSRVLVVEIKDGQPVLTASSPIAGAIAESRLVGTALYVASANYHEVESTNAEIGTVWEWSTQITSLDLSQPNEPVVRSTAEVPSSYGSIVFATDHFLFLAGDQLASRGSWTWLPSIQVFDISAPDGSFGQVSTVTPLGRVKDKFKMNLVEDVFTVVSEQADGTTYVETYSLANAGSPKKLGALKLTQGETLYATRFDSNLLYVVTFKQIDPLWVVDLSDATDPHIAGELRVPGMSTYLYPWGDRLVAVGRDNNGGSQTTVSLFDVHDPAHPALLSRVTPGALYSYSEANYDEKAFGVLPEVGLILLPFSSYTSSNSLQGVQLIDLNPDSVVLRGRVEQDVAARRASVHRGRILSLSGRELLSVDATDRDHPVVRSGTALSWSVDQVLLSGQYLLELDFGSGSAAGPQVRVALGADPDKLLGALGLTNLPVLGATMREQWLYLVQGQSASINWQWDPQYQTNWITTNAGLVCLTVVDLSRLPELIIAGQMQSATLDTFSSQWSALWPRPGMLVWRPGLNGFMPCCTPIPLGGGLPFMPGVNLGLGVAPGGIWGGYGVTDVLWWWPWWGWGSSRLVAFDVRDPTAPAWASDLALDSIQTWNQAPQAFAGEGLVYTSHRAYESIVTGTNYVIVTNAVSELVTNVVTVTNVLQIPQYVSVTNYQIITNLTAAVINRPAGSGDWQWAQAAPLLGVLAGGGHHSLLADPGGAAWAWGGNDFGQLGAGVESAGSDTIAAIANLGGVTSVAAGHNHSLAVKSDGTVWGWGAGFWGQLGNGLPVYPPDQPPLPYDGSTRPVMALGLGNIVSVAAGAYHSLALSAEGEVWAWGANGSGQLGYGAATAEFVPKNVPGLSGVQGIAGGGSHSLAFTKDGLVWAWGGNEFGQLGVGTTFVVDQPTPAPGLSNVVAIAAGGWHSLALDSAGAVWGWGRGDSGQLGDPAGVINTRAVALAGLKGVTALSAGVHHSLALKSDGTVWTWGGNEYGQLGHDNLANSGAGPVDGLSNAVAVAAGATFSLALTADGLLWAWGDDANGQLGDGLQITLTNHLILTNISTVVSYLRVTNIILQTNIQMVTRWTVVTNEYPMVSWLAHDYLDVVDYTVAANPIVRDPVNIPGSLQGISHQGALLYTLAQRPTSDGGSEWTQWLEACAYDGVQAHLVDSLALPNQYPQPILVRDSTVFVGRPAADTNSTAQLQAWALSNTGKFARLGSVGLDSAAQQLAVFGDLMAVRTGNDVQLLNVKTPAALQVIGGGGPEGCVYFDLGRADGSLERGLWLALGMFGVQPVIASP